MGRSMPAQHPARQGPDTFGGESTQFKEWTFAVDLSLHTGMIWTRSTLRHLFSREMLCFGSCPVWSRGGHVHLQMGMN